MNPAVLSRSSLLRRVLAGVLGVGAGLALAPVVSAQPKPAKPAPVPKACNVTAIPMAVGNSWTYEPVATPPELDLTEAQKKQTPLPPQKVVISVSAIDTKDGVTTVTLHEESTFQIAADKPADVKAHDTQITCTAGGARFAVGLDAFWFAGEPGSFHGIELSDIERKGQSLSLAGGKINAAASDWHDDVVAKWKHVPTGKATPQMRSGTVTIARHWVLQKDEAIATKLGSWTTKKLGLENTTTVTLEPAPPEPLKEPVLRVNFLWIADGVGPVQVVNAFGQTFQLNAATLK